MQSRVSEIFRIQLPIVQAGMVWTSGWKLASAVSNAGGLGLIGAGSMHPDMFHEHVKKCKLATSKPFGVNIPLLYPELEKLVRIIVDEKVPIVFTSAGNPKLLTPELKKRGITVAHVVSSAKFAQKAVDAGVDAVVAEGFEAGGHNGKEETTSMVLIPAVRNAVKVPVIAAGGIATGRQMLAAIALGADGVQIGSRFVCTPESSCHPSFKEAVVQAQEGDTLLSMKKLMPVRLLRNPGNGFFQEVALAESRGASQAELKELLGRGRSKKGMFEGNLEEGELEIGQVSALINNTNIPVADVIKEIWDEYNEAKLLLTR